MTGWNWEVPREIGEAWRVIAWWHANRPRFRQVLVMNAEGGPVMALAPVDRSWAPEHVKEARALLGFPRTPRTGEGP